MRAYTIAFSENVKYVIVQSKIPYNAILGKFTETLQKIGKRSHSLIETNLYVCTLQTWRSIILIDNYRRFESDIFEMEHVIDS